MKTPNALQSRCLAALALTTLLTLLTVTPAHAANQFPPGKMTFQGFLTDAANPPVPLGNTSPANTTVIFKIYKSPTGVATADVLWAETQVVTVDKGHFSVLLGEGSVVGSFPHPTDLSGIFIGADASDRWIGLTVDGAEITPRIQFFAAPYAQLAKAANSLVNPSGATILNLANNKLEGTADMSVTGQITSSGSVAGLIFNNREALTGDGSIWQWYSSGGTARLWGGVDKLTVTKDGNMTVTGGATVNGNISATGAISGGSLSVTGNSTVGGNSTVTGNTTVSGATTMASATITGAATMASATVSGNLSVTGTSTLTGNVTVTGTARAAVLMSTTSVASHEQGAWLEWNKVSGVGATYLLNQQGLGVGGIIFGEVSTANAITERMRIDGSGNVGIGITTPAAPLHVKKAGTDLSGSRKANSDTTYGVYLGSDGAVLTAGGADAVAGDNNTIKAGALSAVFDGDIIASAHVWVGSALAYSDARAKNVVSTSDSVRDLSLLRDLKIRDFTWIDKTVDNHRPNKKLVAQEVEQVFPQAVERTPQATAIPNVYQVAEKLEFIDGRKELRLTVGKPHDLRVGDSVDLYTDNVPLKNVKITAVSGAREFAISCDHAPKSVFVYGKYVTDFRAVDYDAIAMLNVSATQELDRQVQALKKSEARIAELEQKVARVAELERKAARVDTLEREMAELKKLVAGLAQGQPPARLTAQNVPTTAGQ